MAFKNLAKFVKYEEKDIGRGFIVIRVHYTDPTYQDPTKVFSVGKPEKDITEELLEKIVALNTDEEVCIHTEKDEKGFNVLVDITDKKDAAKAAQGKPAYKKPYGGGFQPKDDTGIAVGAAYTNAIEILKYNLASVGGLLTPESVANLAEEILYNKLDLEDKLRAKKAAKEAVGVKKAVEEAAPPAVKKKTKLEEMREKKAKEKTTIDTVGCMGDLDEDDDEFVMDED